MPRAGRPGGAARPPHQGYADWDTRHDDRYRRSEILAEACELGPAIALLRMSCPGDAEQLAPIAEFMVDRVWTGQADLSPETALAQPIVSFEAPFVLRALAAAGTDDGEAARVALLGADENDERWMDLRTGEPHEVAGLSQYDQSGRYDVAPGVALPVGLTAPPARPLILPLHTIVQGDRALVVVELIGSRLLPDTTGPRAVVLDGDQWRPVEACPGEVATVFTTPDQLWLAWAEGARVQWAPVDP